MEYTDYYTKYFNLRKLHMDAVPNNLQYINNNFDLIDEALHYADPSTAGVADVRVDGTSVVTNRIAEISLSQYATQSQLSNYATISQLSNYATLTQLDAKQDKLIAGDNITIVDNVISATGGGAGLQYWIETPTRFYREGIHEGISGLANYLKPSTNEVGNWQNGNGWSRCMVTRLKGNVRNVIMGYSINNVDRHPIITYASTEPLDFEWGWSNDTFNPPYGVTTWADKDTYPIPREGYDWYFGWNTGIVTYEGETWYILLIDTYTWAGGTSMSSVDGIESFIHSWENNPQSLGLTLLQTAQAVPYTTAITEISTEDYAFKYSSLDKTYASIDTDGNARFKEITTDAGSLTSQMSLKQNTLAAGTNIQISGDIISATDTTYNDFTGATVQEDGTAGLVPAPTTTESDKFLKGDGTWATPSGGGGSANIVELTQTEYDALPSSKLSDDTLYMVYFDGGQVLDPDYSYYKYGDNNEIVVRVYHEGQADQEIRWYFHEYTQTAALIPIPTELSSYWSGANTAEAYTANTTTVCGWVAVTDYLGGRMGIYSPNWGQYLTGPIDALIVIGDGAEQSTEYSDPYVYIQDSLPFTKIYYNTHEFTHKVTANPSEAAAATLQKLKVDGIVYGVSGGGGGGSFVGLSKSEYDALSTSEKEDTSKLYLVQEGGGIPVVEDLIMTSNDWHMSRESSMTINWVNSEIVFDWTGGSNIGGNIVKKVAIPATASKIRFKITTGQSYSTTVDRFRVFLGVRTTYQTGIILPYYSITDWLAKADFYTNNAVWEDELDLSNVTVDTYLYITAHGWDATVNYLEVVTASGEEAVRHTYWNNAKWSQWNQVKELTQGEYNALSTADRNDGSIYMTHDGGYDFINYDAGKIVVRINNSTNETLWFFNGFSKESADMTVPDELVSYLPTQTSTQSVMMAKAWTDDTSTTQLGWIGFVYPGTTNVKLRSWSSNGAQLLSGTFWAVLDIHGSVAEFGQTLPYSEPTEGLSLLPNRIYYNSTLYADNATGGGGGGNYSSTLLFQGSYSSVGELELSDDITNYDEIEIWINGVGSASCCPYRFNVGNFMANYPYVAGATYNTRHFLPSVFASYYMRIIMGTANNKLYVWDITSQVIKEVYGIKY